MFISVGGVLWHCGLRVSPRLVRLGLVDCLGTDRAMKLRPGPMNLEKKHCGSIGRRHCFTIKQPVNMVECAICREKASEEYVNQLRKMELEYDARYGEKKGYE